MGEADRQYPRHRVSWQVRLRLTNEFFLVGRAVDASLHGLRVALVNWVPSGVLRLREGCTVEVQVDEGGVCCRNAEIRSVSSSGIGLRIGEALPPELMGAAPRCEGDAVDPAPTRSPS
jgi:hypothetical protein